MFRAFAAALILVGACGWSETRFLTTGIPDLCEATAACMGTLDAAACEDHVRAVDRGHCDYDPAMARKCARTLEDGICFDNGDLDTFSFEPPEACNAVYPDCGPLFDWPIDVGTSPPAPQTR